jgi:hypothetical protein
MVIASTRFYLIQEGEMSLFMIQYQISSLIWKLNMCKWCLRKVNTRAVVAHLICVVWYVHTSSGWWLIRCKRIYNFWCSMLVLHQLLYILFTLRGIFYAFSGTNLLTRCHSASSCFLLFFYSRLLQKEIFSESDETIAEVPIFLTRSRSPKGR